MCKMKTCISSCFLVLLSYLDSSWCRPFHSDNTVDTLALEVQTEHIIHSWCLVVGLAALLSSVVIIMGCLCCQQKVFKGFENINNSCLQDNLNNLGNTSEFTIFPPSRYNSDQNFLLDVKFEPLPDIRHRGISNARNQPRPANFTSVVNQGLSVQDWFEEPYSNFPRNNLKYLKEVGSGWFGQVVIGEIQQMGEVQKRKVVVKILREDTTPTDQIYFLHEVKLYRDLDHPNVMKMIGKCLESDPFLIILEYCAFNDLKTYLVHHRTEAASLIQENLLLRMACNIAAGLLHIHSNEFIHTDLATRNCLVTADLQIKIGDYGNSIEKFKDNYYCAGDVAVPIRWCPPEILRCTETTIETKEVTKEANFWSFGITMWEIFEFGKLPYFDLSDEDVLQKVIIQNIVVLPQPELIYNHADKIYQLMRLCWLKDPYQRINIEKLNVLLNHLYSHTNKSCLDFESRWNILSPTTSQEAHNLKRTELPLYLSSLTFEDNFHEISARLHGSVSVHDDKDISVDKKKITASVSHHCNLSELKEFMPFKHKNTLNENNIAETEDLFQYRVDEPNHKVKEEFDAWLLSQEAEGPEATLIAWQISQAINDLDNTLANEKTSSEEDFSKSSPQCDIQNMENIKKSIKNNYSSLLNDSLSDDVTWKEIVSKDKLICTPVTELVREKSHSAQDFLKLTVIDVDNNSDSDTVISDQVGSMTSTNQGILVHFTKDDELELKRPITPKLPLSLLECFASEIVNASVTLAMSEVVGHFLLPGNILDGMVFDSCKHALTPLLKCHLPLNFSPANSQLLPVNPLMSIEDKSFLFFPFDSLINSKSLRSNQFHLYQRSTLISSNNIINSFQSNHRLCNIVCDHSPLNCRFIPSENTPFELNGSPEDIKHVNQQVIDRNICYDSFINDSPKINNPVEEEEENFALSSLYRSYSDSNLLVNEKNTSKSILCVTSMLNLNSWKNCNLILGKTGQANVISKFKKNCFNIENIEIVAEHENHDNNCPVNKEKNYENIGNEQMLHEDFSKQNYFDQEISGAAHNLQSPISSLNHLYSNRQLCEDEISACKDLFCPKDVLSQYQILDKNEFLNSRNVMLNKITDEIEIGGEYVENKDMVLISDAYSNHTSLRENENEEILREDVNEKIDEFTNFTSRIIPLDIDVKSIDDVHFADGRDNSIEKKQRQIECNNKMKSTCIRQELNHGSCSCASFCMHLQKIAMMPVTENSFIIQPSKYFTSSKEDNNRVESSLSIATLSTLSPFDVLLNMNEIKILELQGKERSIISVSHCPVSEEDKGNCTPFIESIHTAPSKESEFSLQEKRSSYTSNNQDSDMSGLKDIEQTLAASNVLKEVDLTLERNYDLLCKDGYLDTNYEQERNIKHIIWALNVKIPTVEYSDKKNETLVEEFLEDKYPVCRKIFCENLISDLHNGFSDQVFFSSGDNCPEFKKENNINSLKQNGSQFSEETHKIHSDDDVLVDLEIHKALLLEKGQPSPNLSCGERHLNEKVTDMLGHLSSENSKHYFNSCENVLLDGSSHHSLPHITSLLDSPNSSVSYSPMSRTVEASETTFASRLSLDSEKIDSKEIHPLSPSKSEAGNSAFLGKNVWSSNVLNEDISSINLLLDSTPLSEVFIEEFEKDSESSSQDSSSTSGEFDCSRNSASFTKRIIYEDSQLGNEDTSYSLRISSWNKDAVPQCSSLRSPQKKTTIKKSVSFNTPKTLIVYEYPHEEKFWQEISQRQMWSHDIYNPAVDLNNFTDWELADEDIPEDIFEAEDIEGCSCIPFNPHSNITPGNCLYKLSNIHYDDGENEDDEFAERGTYEIASNKDIVLNEPPFSFQHLLTDFKQEDENLWQISSQTESGHRLSNEFEINTDLASNFHFFSYLSNEISSSDNLNFKTADVSKETLQTSQLNYVDCSVEKPLISYFRAKAFDPQNVPECAKSNNAGLKTDAQTIEIFTKHSKVTDNQLDEFNYEDKNSNNITLTSSSLEQWNNVNSIFDNTVIVDQPFNMKITESSQHLSTAILPHKCGHLKLSECEIQQSNCRNLSADNEEILENPFPEDSNQELLI